MHPTELQTFSLCDTMKCQMTANLHGEHNWEPPHALLFTSELAFASRLLSSFHTCQNVKKTDDDELLGVVFPVFERDWKSVFIKVCLSRMLPIQMIFVGNGLLSAQWSFCTQNVDIFNVCFTLNYCYKKSNFGLESRKKGKILKCFSFKFWFLNLIELWIEWPGRFEWILELN